MSADRRTYSTDNTGKVFITRPSREFPQRCQQLTEPMMRNMIAGEYGVSGVLTTPDARQFILCELVAPLSEPGKIFLCVHGEKVFPSLGLEPSWEPVDVAAYARHIREGRLRPLGVKSIRLPGVDGDIAPPSADE